MVVGGNPGVNFKNYLKMTCLGQMVSTLILRGNQPKVFSCLFLFRILLYDSVLV